MTIYTWVGGGGGAWNVGGNWDPSTGFPNGFADEAIIPAGATTVAISGASYTVGVLQMYAGTTLALTNSATLTVYAPDPSGDLTTLSGTISVDGTSVLQFANAGWTTADLGTINAASGATLFFETSLDNSGATLALAPGVILKGEIDGGTITGAINFAASGFVTLVDGPVLKGAGGTGPGLVQDIANGSTLRLQDTTTISNTTINIGNAANTAFLSLRDTKGGGQLVTLATDVTVNVANFAAFNGGAYANDTLDNKGAINVTAMGASLTISTPIFTNDGTITIANGDTLQFSNSLLTNKGTISVDDTSTIHFAGLTTAQLGTLNATAANSTAGTAGATVDFGGTGLDNTGAVFKPVNGVNYEGAITGGTIEGGLILAAFAKLELDGSPVVTGAFGTGAGFIDAANGGSTLALGSTQTIDNATILLGNSVISQVADNTITTFGPNVTIDILGNTTFQGSQTGAGIVNQGAIDDSLNESFPTMVGISFTNEGSMTFSNHDGFVVDNSVTFKNAAGATITASAGANGQSYILFQGSIVNDGTITVDGFGSIASEIDYYHAVTGTGTTDITGGGLADFFESMTPEHQVHRRRTAAIELEHQYRHCLQLRLQRFDQSDGPDLARDFRQLDIELQHQRAHRHRGRPQQRYSPEPGGRLHRLCLHAVRRSFRPARRRRHACHRRSLLLPGNPHLPRKREKSPSRNCASAISSPPPRALGALCAGLATARWTRRAIPRLATFIPYACKKTRSEREGRAAIYGSAPATISFATGC